jgi:hypothetical protein
LDDTCPLLLRGQKRILTKTANGGTPALGHDA